MIRNIIFDLGNVLISWKPEEFLIKSGLPADEREELLNSVFRSPEWLMLDNGDISIGAAVKSISEKSGLSEARIKSVFDMRLKILHPLGFNTILLPGLKKEGFRLYFLSNFPDDIFDEVHNRYDFFRYFDGGEISARLNASKPDEKIFRLMLEKYQLRPEESLFIDDSHSNATSAGRLGMHVIHLHEPSDLKMRLEKMLKRKVEIAEPDQGDY